MTIKTLRALLVGLLIAGLSAPVFAQDDPPTGDDTGRPDRPEVERPFVIPDELADKMDDLREARAALRADLRAILEANSEVTEEERRALIDGWREANAEAIAANRTLAQEIRAELRELRPERPSPIEIPDELQAKMDSYRAEREAIATLRRDFLEPFREEPREVIRAQVEAFNELYAERIDANKALAAEIRGELSELRGDLPGRPNRPEPTEEVLALRADFREKAAEIHETRVAFRAAYAEAAEEDQEALREAFRAEMRTLRQELNEIKRALRQAERGRGGNGG